MSAVSDNEYDPALECDIEPIWIILLMVVENNMLV